MFTYENLANNISTIVQINIYQRASTYISTHTYIYIICMYIYITYLYIYHHLYRFLQWLGPFRLLGFVVLTSAPAAPRLRFWCAAHAAQEAVGYILCIIYTLLQVTLIWLIWYVYLFMYYYSCICITHTL